MKVCHVVQVSSEFDDRWPVFDSKLRHTILPIFWAEEVGQVSDSDAHLFTHKVYPVVTRLLLPVLQFDV